MAQYSDDLCCDLTLAIGEGTQCDKLPGGIEDVRLGCLKFFSAYTEGACTTPTTAVLSAITSTDPDTSNPVVPLYPVVMKSKTGSYEFVMTYDNATDTNKIAETIEFDITALGTEARCALLEYRGQEVAVFFKYRGSAKWYVAGWKGGIRVTEINGGSGLENRRRTHLILSGDDVGALAIEFFDTDVATTDTEVDALTN